MREWDNATDKIFNTVGENNLFPIVCLGKGNTALSLCKEFKEKIAVVDRDFETFSIDGFGIPRETWGSNFIKFEKTPQRIQADFESVEFNKQCIGALFIPEIFLIKKDAGAKLLNKAKNWISPNGLIVITTPSIRDVRYQNFKKFGKLQEYEPPYNYLEITKGGIVADPPIVCPMGCPHEFFSFYDFPEIESHLSGDFKKLEAVENTESAADAFLDMDGEFKTLLYAAIRI